MNENVRDEVARERAELAALRVEKEMLSSQVKRLVRAESKLYEYQEQLDIQLKQYKELYELNKRLGASLELPAIFEQATAYIINNLGYERVLFFQQSGSAGGFAVCASDGYYDPRELSEVSRLTVSRSDPLLAPLFHGAEYLICTENCRQPELSAFRSRVQMDEYLLHPLGSREHPVALLAVGNSAPNAQHYSRVSGSEGELVGIGNLVGLLSSAIENQILYAGMKSILEQERVAEAKYRGIFENATEGIFQTTPQGRFLSCNSASAAILGYDTPEEAIESVSDIWQQICVTSQRLGELMETVLGGGTVQNFEAQFSQKDGSRRWVRLSLRPFFTENSELLHIDGIIQDITEGKRNEESLIKLSQAVEQSPVTIVITDTKGNIEFVNPKFTHLTGYTYEEALGKNPRVLKSEFNSPGLYRELWDTITAGKVWEGEFLNKKKSGELFAEHATISPIRNRDGVVTHYLAIKEDITERRQLEAQLIQSQKMESIGRLAGGVAHDFNNMLSVILGCVQLAMLRVSEGEKLWQYLEQISKAAQRSSDITRQLLAFSRKEIISPKEVNLNAQIIATQATLGRLIGEDVKLSFRPVTNIWSIKADPSQLDQILVNLAVNARDAMANGGSIAIETANVHIDRTYCQYHLDSTPGDYVRLAVSDSGSGMDRQTLTHIFEPFFTTKEVGKGTGLGLSTVYGIVRQNNGFINVYSEPGHGTTFQIYFPRCSGTAEIAEEFIEAEISGSGTVLLVEDDPLVREMARQMLEEIGYTVIESETAEQAVETCARGEVQIDVILTDVVMPGMNGKEMVAVIETMRPGIKVLFMSGYTSDLVAQRGVVDAGRHFIQKPFDMHSLSEKIRDALLGDQRSAL
ncbi:MAG: hybrid sensor histidine kinase/response regulator [Geobacteraceae bacterium GWC2_58_44]|nr:MAG: hybrid sensor histidine kinase/response regulator [Geobacteraceae bacterium GWC2_58_44]HBG04139.1 PAS domain-containing sensor histidine kinase [Geobacter sp.]